MHYWQIVIGIDAQQQHLRSLVCNPVRSKIGIHVQRVCSAAPLPDVAFGVRVQQQVPLLNGSQTLLATHLDYALLTSTMSSWPVSMLRTLILRGALVSLPTHESIRIHHALWCSARERGMPASMSGIARIVKAVSVFVLGLICVLRCPLRNQCETSLPAFTRISRISTVLCCGCLHLP